MFEKVTHLPLVVKDQERALQFYTQVLGFEKRQDYQQKGRPRWLTVAPKGQELEFILIRGEYVKDPRPPRDKVDTGGHHWVLRTDDCRKDFEALKARGLKFKAPGLVTAPFGIAAYFADLDGNHFSLLQPSSKASG